MDNSIIQMQNSFLNKMITPELTNNQKSSIHDLAQQYYKYRDWFRYYYLDTQTLEGSAATRNDYASLETAVSDREEDDGRYKIQCSLFVQLIWMGRSLVDFTNGSIPSTSSYDSSIEKSYSNIITTSDLFKDSDRNNWGYYFDFSLRTLAYGVYKTSNNVADYYGFMTPNTNNSNSNSYTNEQLKNSYSYNTGYTGASQLTDSNKITHNKFQTFTNFMSASEMARELYEKGCEISFNELQQGDIVFFRPGSLLNNTGGSAEWNAFRNINHVAIVYRITNDGKPIFIESTEADKDKPIVVIDPYYANASNFEKTRYSALLRRAVMCARHPVAWGKNNMAGDNLITAITTI